MEERPVLNTGSVNEDDLRILILESTDLILERIGLAERNILGEPRPRDPEPLPNRMLDIPQPVSDILVSMAKNRYGSLESIPVVQGVDEIVFHLDRATQWHLRREPSRSTLGENHPKPSRSNHAFKMASILTAYWLLHATKEASEYRMITAHPITSIDEFEKQLVRWGMTTHRFISKLEEVCPLPSVVICC